MNVQFKGGLILIVLVAALYYVFPTFKAYQSGVDPQTVADKVNLGLDLQGGMYLDIEVERDVAVEEIVRRTRDNLEDLLIDEQVDFISPAIKMCHQTNMWCVQIDQDPRIPEMRLKRRGGTFGKTGKHHIGLDLTWIDCDLRQFRKHFGKTNRIGMILGEAFDMMIQRINPSSGKNADLAHATTHQLAYPVRTADHVL